MTSEVNLIFYIKKPLRKERLFFSFDIMVKVGSFILLMLLMACSSAPELVQMTNQGPAQGSTYSISYLVPAGIDYREDIDSILLEMDHQMSLWVNESDVSRLNRGDTILLSIDLAEVIRRSKEYAILTEGNFDVTIAPLIKSWGFSRGSYNAHINIDSLMSFVGSRFIKDPFKDSTYWLPQGYQIDVNGIAQGHTVDRIADFLTRRGIVNYLVEVGGEVICSGAKNSGDVWRIGIDMPTEDRGEGMFQTIVILDSMALATSGNYRKYWVNDKGQKVVHSINPKTGYPVVSNLLSSSIIAPTAVLADALGTACMIMGVDRASSFIESLPHVEGYFIISNKLGDIEVVTTSGWAAYEFN